MRRVALTPGNQKIVADAVLSYHQSLTPEHLQLRPTFPLSHENSEIEATTLAEVFPRSLYERPVRTCWRKFNTAYCALFLCAVVLSFVLDNLRVLALPVAADWVVDSVEVGLIVVFGADLLAEVRRNDRFLWSFFFWMDAAATLGIAADIEAISGRLGANCCEVYGYRLKTAFRSMRLAGCSLRLIHHLRLLKTASLCKPPTLLSESYLHTKQRQKNRANSAAVNPQQKDAFLAERRLSAEFTMDKREPVSEELGQKEKLKRGNTLYRVVRDSLTATMHRRRTVATKATRESEISKKLTMRLVAIFVTISTLVSVFCWFTLQKIGEFSASNCEYGLKLIQDSRSAPRFDEIVWEFVAAHVREYGLESLQELKIDGKIAWSGSENEIRRSEKCEIVLPHVSAVFSLSETSRIFAVFDLCSTLLVSFLVILVTLQHATDVHNLVVFPLERMIDTVRSLAYNPMVLGRRNVSAHSENAAVRKCWETQRNYAEEEVALLENAFLKIGVMLSLVYGSAGSRMITDSMIAHAGEVCALAPGREVVAIFCFARINNFPALLESLGDRTFQYVNLISSLVHHKAEQLFGSVNRNLGDSYLLVWKFPAEDEVMVHRKPVLNPFSPEVKSSAGLALLFAVKSISKCARSRDLFVYQHMKKQKKLTHTLTFGFHAGWAYEGPIGSVFKIDASYLSPNVNLAARIEGATKNYGVVILVSEEMHMRLDERVKSYLRHVDTVRLQGVQDAAKLFSFDLTDGGLTPSTSRPDKGKTERKRSILHDALDQSLISVPELFLKSDTVRQLRRHYTSAFLTSYRQALQLYSSGQWTEAAQILFSVCMDLVPFDGPTKALISFMGKTQYIAPINWTGVRALDSK